MGNSVPDLSPTDLGAGVARFEGVGEMTQSLGDSYRVPRHNLRA